MQLTKQHIVPGVILLVLIALLIAVYQHVTETPSDIERVKQFIKELAHFSVRILLLSALSLLIVYLTQLIRNTEFFDKNGAAIELGTIRTRIGTDQEAEGDSIAVAIQYAATTILMAAIISSFFLMH